MAAGTRGVGVPLSGVGRHADCVLLRSELRPNDDTEIPYARHEPEKTLLHRVVREDLASFISRSRAAGAPVARFVEREIRVYLECGVLAHGFLRVHCDACGHDRLVAFSCKGRGFCPSCGGRRMADTPAQLVDRILPEVPVRQWVLTLPSPLRYRCAWNARLTGDVLGCFVRALFSDQRRRAKRDLGVRRGLCGSVTFIQRFGSALNLTPHFHALVLDGVYEGPRHAPGRFHELDPPETADVARVLAGTARRIRRLFESSRLEETGDPVREDDPLMAMLGAASIRSRIASGPEAGSPWRRLGDRVELVDEENEGANGVEPAAKIPPRCVRGTGMWRSAGPFAGEESSLGERVDGDPFAPAAAPVGSPSVSSQPPRPSPPSLMEPRAREGHDSGSLRATKKDPRRRTAWADLLQRVFEVDALCCPRCGGRMRILRHDA